MTIGNASGTGGAAAALVLLAAGTLGAHHSIAAFDAETLVRVEGVIIRFDPVNPHSYLIVEATTGDGQVERWALEGPSGFQLDRSGFDPEIFRIGEPIAACGFVLKVERRPRGADGRVLLATTLRFADGRGRIWSDYGQAHRCVALDRATRYVPWHGRGSGSLQP